MSSPQRRTYIPFPARLYSSHGTTTCIYITMQYSALLSTMQNSFALKKFFPTALCDAFNKGKNPSNTKDSIVQRKMFGL